MPSLNLCVIVPVYNHGDGIRRTVAKLEPFGYACLIVDDGSDQPCADAIDEAAAGKAWVEVLRHPANQGKGAAVKTALRHAHERGFTHALQIDADEQHDVREIPALVAAAETDPEAIVLGTPVFDESVPKVRLVSRYLTHVWVWINTLSMAIPDAMCGFRIYPVGSLVTLIDEEATGNHMEFDIEVLVAAKWRGARFVPVTVHTHYPDDGVSHFNLLADNWRISKAHAKAFFSLAKRPFERRA